MPDPITAKTKIMDVKHRTWDKDGKKGQAWDATFEGGNKASTFSTTAGKVLEENKGKTVVMTVVDSGRTFQDKPVMNITGIADDKGTVLYEPGRDDPKRPGYGGSGGGGFRGGGSSRPEWSYDTPEERQQTRTSIERQKAADVAQYVLAGLVQYDESVATQEGALAFMEKAIDRIHGAISKGNGPPVKKKSGSGERSSSTARPTGDRAPTAEGRTAVAVVAASSVPVQDVPTPSDPDVVSAVEELLTTLADAEHFGTRGKALIAYRKHFDRPALPEQMTVAELSEMLLASKEAANA